jgi:hypothetical protein
MGVGACFALIALAGCGDAPTSDTRGFTKAPLEVLGLFIESEIRSDVREFARLNLPDAQRIASPADSAGD